MKATSVLILSFIFFLLSRAESLAWSSPGHIVIAEIAYSGLSTSGKNQVNELLKHHPDYTRWKDSYQTNSDFDLDTFVFMRASTWPDEIRRRGSPYDHPEWHYIDYPLEPPSFPEKPDVSPTNDILYGIRQAETFIKNKNTTLEERAVYLSWLIHLLGDLHQPLHCATLVNSVYSAPIGDKGGNDFYVRPSEAPINLHSIWDKALGGTVNFRTQFNYATEIRSEHPRKDLPELSTYKTPEGWSIESRQIAIESGYLNGNLKGSKDRDSAPPLPDDYTNDLKPIAEKRAALAGYRLADEITKCLQP